MAANLLIPAGVAVGSAIMGGDKAKEAKKAAERQRQQAMQAFSSINIPTLEEMQTGLYLPEEVGQFSPEMLKALEMPESEMGELTADAQLKAIQEQYLSDLEDRTEGGLSESDMATIRDIRRQVEGADQARQEAILQEMAQRGVLGSGMELAARKASQQEATDRMSRAGDELAQQESEAAFRALQELGGAASQIRSQEFGEESAAAQARDRAAMIASQNQQRVADQNVGMGNQAQMANLAYQRQLAETKRQEQLRRDAVQRANRQQQFDNRISRASGIASGSSVGSQQQAAATQAEMGMIGQIGGNLIKGAGAFLSPSKTSQQAAQDEEALLNSAEWNWG